MDHIILCITGASGLPVAKRFLEVLKEKGVQRTVIITEGAKKLALAEEIDLTEIEILASEIYDETDLASNISSTSNFADAVVVLPASLKTLGLIANGIPSNLVARVANNALRMRKPLIVCPRETPLSTIDLQNMVKISQAGGIVLPLNLAFYFHPKGVEDIINFLVGRVLDCLDVKHTLYQRWTGK